MRPYLPPSPSQKQAETRDVAHLESEEEMQVMRDDPSRVAGGEPFP